LADWVWVFVFPHHCSRPPEQKAKEKKLAERKAAIDAEIALSREPRPRRNSTAPVRFDQEEILSALASLRVYQRLAFEPGACARVLFALTHLMYVRLA
jgi:hypothetical protein